MSTSPRWRPRLVAWTSLSALVLVATAAAADPAPPYADLLVQAQSAAPRLSEAEAAVSQAQGLERQAAARPNPTADVTIENFPADKRSTGQPTETTFEVGQPLELGGKRRARMAAGRAGVDAARAKLGQTRADYAFDLAVAYANAEAADRRAGLAAEALKLAEEDLRAAKALVDAGKEAELRTVQAQAAVTAARAAVSTAQSGRAAAFAQLTALAGSSAPFTSLSESLLARSDAQRAPADVDPQAVPAVRSAEAEREAAARRMRVEQTRAVPDVTASVGVRHFSFDGGPAMVAGVSVPLPLFDRNRGNIGAAKAELNAAEARLKAARLDAEAELSTARFDIGAAQSREAAAKQGEATAAEAYRLTRIAYDSGKASLVELTAARRALADARNQTIDAQLERLRAYAGLERLQGRSPFETVR